VYGLRVGARCPAPGARRSVPEPYRKPVQGLAKQAHRPRMFAAWWIRLPTRSLPRVQLPGVVEKVCVTAAHPGVRVPRLLSAGVLAVRAGVVVDVGAPAERRVVHVLEGVAVAPVTVVAAAQRVAGLDPARRLEPLSDVPGAARPRVADAGCHGRDTDADRLAPGGTVVVVGTD